MILDTLEFIYRSLPGSFQPYFFKTVVAIYKINYQIKYKIPFIKARLMLAYHGKYLPSDEYRQIAIEHNPYFASEAFNSKEVNSIYFAQITWKELLQCIFIPYTVIDRYSE